MNIILYIYKHHSWNLTEREKWGLRESGREIFR